jgi:hypothetical protein
MNGCISDTLPVMDRLLSHLEEFKLKMHLRSYEKLNVAIDQAWEKLDYYYKLSDQSSVYTVALIMDPRIKMFYFIRQWSDHPEWIVAAKEKVEEYYRKYSIQYPGPTPEVPPLMLYLTAGCCSFCDFARDGFAVVETRTTSGSPPWGRK